MNQRAAERGVNVAAPSLLPLSTHSWCFLWLLEQLTERKSRGRGVCNRSCRLFTPSFLQLSPHVFYPLPFDVPGPSSLIQRASQRAGPAPAGSPSLCRLGCAEPTWSEGPAPLSSTPQKLIDGCTPAHFTHRSHCFNGNGNGKSRSNIFHISSPSWRIDMDVCSIYPQTSAAERNALRTRHSTAPHGCNCPLRQRPWRSFHTRAKVQPGMFSSWEKLLFLLFFNIHLFLPDWSTVLIKVLLFSKQAV